MGFRTGAYATIWEVKPSANYSDVKISISKKNKQTEKYEQDFGGYVRFIGDAHKKVASLKEKDRIKLGDCDVTNTYDKEKKVMYTNYALFTFETTDGSQATNKPNSNDFVNVPENIDEELPFN